ncbi:T9SS type A sorting domain-containing protein [candidate division KSB1 bacterium]|nr:T9SS type A sorting domain-containing protein [candidate division KSB1 bacterium]
MIKPSRLVKTFLPAILVAFCLLLGETDPLYATWQTLMTMDFEVDDPMNWPPLYDQWRVSPLYTHHWGIQDYLCHYNPGAGIQAAWCVASPGFGQLPLDPVFDDYPNNCNTFMIYGPVDLSTTEAAFYSFWYWINTEVNHDFFRWLVGLGTASGPPSVFQIAGELSGQPSVIWQQIVQDLTAVGPDSLNFTGPGNNYVYIAFHFQSDGNNIAADHPCGAFVDDVRLARDDGLMDLWALNIVFIDEDSQQVAYPLVGDSVYIGFRWGCLGIGETDTFTLQGFLDDSLMLSERRTAWGDSTYLTRLDSLWIVTPDSHFVLWVLDVFDEVQETYEVNNEDEFFWMPECPPSLQIISPPATGDTTNMEYTIRWVDEDPDDNAQIILFYDADSIGYDGTYLEQAGVIYEDDEQDSFVWNTASLPHGFRYYIYGLIWDDDVQDSSAYSGPLVIDHSVGVVLEELGEHPEAYCLFPSFPNPFNVFTTLRYRLPRMGRVSLKVYNLLGEGVATLVDGVQGRGDYRVRWDGDGLPSGIYWVRFDVGPYMRVQKIVLLK